MLSGADFKAQVAKSMQTFQTLEVANRGEGKDNLVVDGAGKGQVYVEADESVVLLADGDDFAQLSGDFNQIDIQGGNNEVYIKGSDNELNADNSNNVITASGNRNLFDVNKGNNDIWSEGDYNYIKADNGDNSVRSGGNDNRITADHGNNSITSGGDRNTINADNGNNTITSRGYDKENHAFGGQGNENYITTNNGNNTIDSRGDLNTIYSNNGNNTIISGGNKNDISAYNGSNYVLSVGDENNIKTGNGNDAILSVGDHNDIKTGDGNNSIVFDGNDTNIRAGNGDNYISTLDFAIMNEAQGSVFAYSDFADRLDGRTKTTTTSEVTDSYLVSERVISQQKNVPETVTSNMLDKLTDLDKNYLNKIDFSEKAADGSPKYLVAKGKTDGEYHIYEYSNKTTYKAVAGFTDGKRDYGKISSGNGYLYLNNNTKTGGLTEVVTTTYTKTEVEETRNVTYKDTIESAIKGVNDVNITVGSGSNTMALNVANNLSIDGVSLQTGSDGKYVHNDKNILNNIFVTGEIVTETTATRMARETSTRIDESDEKTTTSYVGGDQVMVTDSYSTGSPLIVDFNQDGVVSAIAGKGVDIDNNGYADGAATGGDKMLAMSDMNGNAHIDGGEVFGDQTISPFTGEKLNAKNGFEALKMIAEQAQEHTGINCISNGEVNLSQLQSALKSVGINLGFISDGNITELEDLGHVASINVQDYTEQDESGEVQHRQLGSYTDTEGQQYKTNDVWFKLFGK